MKIAELMFLTFSRFTINEPQKEFLIDFCLTNSNLTKSFNKDSPGFGIGVGVGFIIGISVV